MSFIRWDLWSVQAQETISQNIYLFTHATPRLSNSCLLIKPTSLLYHLTKVTNSFEFLSRHILCCLKLHVPNFKATNFGSCFGLRTSWFSYYLQFMQEFVQFFLCKHWQSDFTAPVTNWKGSIRCFAENLVGKIGKTKRFVLIYINVSFNSLG